MNIEGVIAAFVPGKGFTCLATKEEDSDGTDISIHQDKNGEICLTGLHTERHDLMREASKRCRSIRSTGRWYVAPSFGSVACGLS